MLLIYVMLLYYFYSVKNSQPEETFEYILEICILIGQFYVFDILYALIVIPYIYCMNQP